MGVFVDLAQLVQQGWGWAIPMLWLFWQGIGTKHIPRYDPMLAPLVSAGERLDTVEQNQEDIVERIEDLDEKQVHHIQATRANSRALDETTDVSIDADEIDGYLVDNGVPVTTFTIQTHSSRGED